MSLNCVAMPLKLKPILMGSCIHVCHCRIPFYLSRNQVRSDFQQVQQKPTEGADDRIGQFGVPGIWSSLPVAMGWDICIGTNLLAIFLVPIKLCLLHSILFCLATDLSLRMYRISMKERKFTNVFRLVNFELFMPTNRYVIRFGIASGLVSLGFLLWLNLTHEKRRHISNTQSEDSKWN